MVCMVLLVCIVSLSSAYGFEYYKTMGTMYNGNPVYCIMEPDPEIEPRYEYVSEVTKNAIAEWSVKLAESTNGNWNMYYQVYAFDQHKDRTTDDFKQCNAFINFIDRARVHGAIGTATANIEGGYYWVEIRTQIPQTKITISLGGGWSNSTATVKNTSDVELTDIRNVLLHEIGHTLGLEHYYCEPIRYDCVDESVMYYKIAINEGEIKKLSERDINMIVRIYGSDGFRGWHNPVGEICLVGSSNKVC